MTMTRRRRRRRFTIGLLILLVGGVAVLVLDRSGQPEVSASVFPTVAGGVESLTYVDCSKIDAISYHADNPCETFILVRRARARSAPALFVAQEHALRRAGWRPTAPQPADFNQIGGMAHTNESWISTAQQACAYVAPVRLGAAAEAKGLFPYVPANQPHGVLDFYRRATRANRMQTLWVRLTPSYEARC